MSENFFTKYSPAQWHGIAFDVIIVIFNFTLLPFLDSKIQEQFDASFRDENSFLIGVFIIILYLWRLTALWLKRKPFAERMVAETDFDREDREGDGCGMAGCVWFFSLFSSLLGIAVLITAVLVLSKDTGFGDFSDYDNAIGFAALAIIGIELWLLYRLFKVPPEDEIKEIRERLPKFERNINSPREIFADLGLFAYIFLWQAFFYYFMSTVIVPNFLNSVLNFIGGILISLLVFVMFYIGPRMILLVEDMKYAWTWITIPLVFLSGFISHLLF